MTFDRRIVGFHIVNLEIWSISYGIHNFSYTPDLVEMFNSNLYLITMTDIDRSWPIDMGLGREMGLKGK